MKNAILTVTLIFTTSVVAFAGTCRPEYQAAYVELSNHTLPVAGLTLVGGLLAGFPSLAAGASSGALLTTGAGALAGGGVITVGHVLQSNARHIIKLLDQSKVGVGLELTAFAADLKSNQESIARIINNLDSQKAFCANGETLALGDIAKLVNSQLNK